MDLLLQRVPDKGFVYYRGSIGTSSFIFWARGSEWVFAVGENEGPFPRRFLSRKGTYGQGPEDASHMPADVAERIIRQCVEEYEAGVSQPT